MVLAYTSCNGQRMIVWFLSGSHADSPISHVTATIEAKGASVDLRSACFFYISS